MVVQSHNGGGGGGNSCLVVVQSQCVGGYRGGAYGMVVEHVPCRCHIGGAIGEGHP